MKQEILKILMILYVFSINSLICKDAEIEKNDLNSLRARIVALKEEQKKFIPDADRKEKDVLELVNQAVEHLKNAGIETACSDFRFQNKWYKGEIFIFVLDTEGYIVCHGDNSNLIWKNINAVPNALRESIFDTIKKVDTNGEWLSFRWNNGSKFSYLKKIILNNEVYYVGAGYFPQTKKYIAKQLVKSAIAYFKQVPSQVAFTRMSNVNDVFVVGDVSMYAGDFEGNLVASSYDAAFVNQNLLNFKDSKGNYPIKMIIKSLRKKQNAWIQYYWLDQIQNNYIEKIKDPRSGKDYFFLGSYRPESDEIYATDLLISAIAHLNKVGANQAFRDFSSASGPFVKGGISIFAYDFDGKSLANGKYPSLVGQNLIETKDKNNKFVVKEIISVAKKYGRGIVTTLDKNSGEKLIFTVIDTPTGKVIVGATVYSQDKALTVKMLVEKGIRYIENNSLVQALNAFADPTEEFYNGDAYIFVYNPEGIVLVNGEYRSTIGQENLKAKDDNSKRILENLINISQKGGGWYTYPYRNGQRRVYVNQITIENKVTKQKERYIIGSGYYL